MRCHECRDVIAVLHDDDPTDAALRSDLAAHLAECPQCASDAGAARLVHERLTRVAEMSRNGALADEVMSRIERRGAGHATPFHRRLRYALGLAALIALAVTAALLWPSNGGGGSSAAFASVVRHVREADSLSCTITVHTGTQMQQMHAILLGQEAARLRMPDERIIITTTHDDQSLMLIPATRIAIRNPRVGLPMDLREMLLSLVPNVVEVLGTEIVDDVELVVLRAPWPEGLGGGGTEEWTVTVWADLHSGLPVRVEAMTDIAGDNSQAPPIGQRRIVFSDLVFDEPVDPALFSMDAPPGYTLESISFDPVVAAAATTRKMVNILMACQIYMTEHDGQWPGGLDELERYGIDAEALKNPRYPERAVGFAYIRPAPEAPPGSTMVLHEVTDDWGAGINVGFADTRVQFVTDRTAFEAMVGEGE
jgi:hypothetical protein